MKTFKNEILTKEDLFIFGIYLKKINRECAFWVAS